MPTLRSVPVVLALAVSCLFACATTPAQQGPGAAIESIHNPPNAPPVPEDEQVEPEGDGQSEGDSKPQKTFEVNGIHRGPEKPAPE